MRRLPLAVVACLVGPRRMKLTLAVMNYCFFSWPSLTSCALGAALATPHYEPANGPDAGTSACYTTRTSKLMDSGDDKECPHLEVAPQLNIG